tara:strand:- start:671 stop:892 length:222 start_codon:yes stop_codon:yes gene_type:complete
LVGRQTPLIGYKKPPSASGTRSVVGSVGVANGVTDSVATCVAVGVAVAATVVITAVADDTPGEELVGDGVTSP